MKTYESKKGYYYKEYQNGKKVRISQQTFEKLNTKVGGKPTCRMCRGDRDKKSREMNYTHRRDLINLWFTYKLNTSNRQNIKKNGHKFVHWKSNNKTSNHAKLCTRCYNDIGQYKNYLIKNFGCKNCKGIGKIKEIVPGPTIYRTHSGRECHPGPEGTYIEEETFNFEKKKCPKCEGRGYIEKDYIKYKVGDKNLNLISAQKKLAFAKGFKIISNQPKSMNELQYNLLTKIGKSINDPYFQVLKRREDRICQMIKNKESNVSIKRKINNLKNTYEKKKPKNYNIENALKKFNKLLKNQLNQPILGN